MRSPMTPRLLSQWMPTVCLSAVCLAAVALAACRDTPSETTPVMNGRSQPLRVGEAAGPINGSAFSLTLLAVLEDARCPRQVVCISAGTADISLGYRVGSGPTVPVRLRWGAAPSDTVIGTVRVRFDSLVPWPEVPGPLLPQDRYVAWLTLRTPP